MQRLTKMENSDLSFKDVVHQMSLLPQNSFFLTPVVGPESIVGSTRMKGGSCTKILLEVLFSLSLSSTFAKVFPLSQRNSFPFLNNDTKISQFHVLKCLTLYQDTLNYIYSQSYKWKPLIEQVGKTLSENSSVFYLSQNPYAGFLGITDASECPPTFGASHNDVRGFVKGGWGVLGFKQRELSDNISFEYFRTQVLTSNQRPLKKTDIIILLNIEEQVKNNNNDTTSFEEIKKEIRSNQEDVQIFQINIKRHTTSRETKDIEDQQGGEIDIELPEENFDLLEGVCSLAEFGLKLILNSLTTIGFLLHGKVFGNYMIDLRVSNHKLFYRAIRIVKMIVDLIAPNKHCTEVQARKCLLQSIYEKTRSTRTRLAR